MTFGLVTAGAAVVPALPAAADPAGDAAAFVADINALRASHGLRLLSVDPRLVSIASAWSQHLASVGTISHNFQLGNQAPADWKVLGENVGVGPTVDSLQGAFTASPEHYANMVDASYNAIGVAVTYSATGAMFVTEDYEDSPSAPNTRPLVASSPATSPAPAAPAPAPAPPVNPDPTQGYRLVAHDGGVFSYGTSSFKGSTGAMRLAAPIVGGASTPGHGGYWLVAADGGIFSFGDAAFHGSTGAMRLASPIVGMAPTPSGAGYWLVAADGGIFSFGDAAFHGSTGGLHLTAPIIGMSATSDGQGYRLVAADGGVFSFGDAEFDGSPVGSRLAAPIVAVTG
ncbi:MAG TPA: CAP domain-containing protein [Acidimicrobiales bacterium]|nr:CAP domain-containing protein [Acidimicrobiales bacterium]